VNDEIPPGGRAWLDDPPVQHGALWRFGEWLLTSGNLEAALCCVILAMFSIFVVAGWLVGEQR
jgi:hypothetical protein